MKRKTIKNYENYEITETGTVFSIFINKSLVPRAGKGGYLYVNLYNKDGKKSKKIHRLVAEAFLKNPNNYPVVNHLDGDKLNNHMNNLEWCTFSQNTQHAYSKGLINLDTEARRNAAIKNGKEYRSRKIKMRDSLQEMERVFCSATQCSEEMRFPLSSITSSIRRNIPYMKRYYFSYLD